MNNTTTTKGNLSLVAILMEATLVIGTFATMATTIGTTQSSTAFAYSQQKKKGGDDNNSRNGNTITALKCQNRGSASGFDTTVDQECENLICTHPASGASCVSEAAAVSNKTGGGIGGVCNSPLIEAHVGSTAGPLICANPSDITEPDMSGLCGGSDRVDLFVDSTHLCLSLGPT